MKLRDR
jgi:ATP-dependent DNA helicase 2 subunit 2